MKEKQFGKWMLIRALMIIGIYLMMQCCDSLLLGREFETEVVSSQIVSASDIDIKLSEEGILNVENVHDVNGNAWMTLKEEKAGEVELDVIDNKTGEIIESTCYKTSKNGLVVNMNNGNFSNYRINQFNIISLFIFLSALAWTGFFKAKREFRYSYSMVFCVGFGMWLGILSLVLLYGLISNMNMLTLYSTLQQGAYLFILVTFPFLFIFCVLLSFSNLDLIHHEGFSFKNILGILLSLCIIGGVIALLMIDHLITGGSEVMMDAWSSFIGSLYCVYALLECFLAGAFICAFVSTRVKPDYDKDYIIVLGCAIRKDGGLYPLIRSRVDKAIDFYERQKAATSKEAIFITSGGKGDDECISEGEAMRNYLIEKGFAPDKVIAETHSKNTKENLKFSRELMKSDGKAIFSTNQYHLFRSGIIANKMNFNVEGIGSRSKWYFWPNALVREVVGMVVYKWRDLVIAFIPIAAFFIVIQFAF